jgi:hypothetical protein
VSPTRAYFLEGPPPTKLTKASFAVFQLRTESAKTKDWRWRHNQPLDDEPINRTCSLCKRAQETVIHLVEQCPSTEARQARRILKSYYTRAKQDVPVGPHEILRRFEDAELLKSRRRPLRVRRIAELGWTLDGTTAALANSGSVLMSSVPR